ncbi:D-glucuronyl C5-epimerase family protein [Streptomyces asoensis]|uniref:D-glucuronyl C5-epimerase family protein n=1 Tax=Streptomyces asoensis TaxID=249586 RepID=UPI0037180657
MIQAGYRLVTDLPEEMRPWRDRPVAWANVSPATGTYHLDSSGVYRYYPTASSEGLDHPVGQIQFGLGCLASYRTETDPARRGLFLVRARAQADRLIDQRVEERGAWWFPYPFAFTHSVHTGVTYQPPWFSGMAQGEAISLFVQLAQVEELSSVDRAAYRAAADAAFASLQLGDDGYPWVTNVDSDGYWWIQEYPANPQGTGLSDYTYNGMVYALLGIYDYYCATGSQAAADLYDAGATTLAAHFPRLRNPKWASFYCDTHRIPAPTYHWHHVELLRQVQWHTGSPDWADRMDRLVDDYPATASGTIRFEPGTHTLYQLDTASSGAWVESKGDRQLASRQVTFAQATQAPAVMRRRIQGRGIYCLIAEGAYGGWWVGESWTAAYLLGVVLPTLYWPGRTVTFPGGGVPVDVCKVAADGTVSSRRTVSFTNPSNAPVSQRAIVNGRAQYLISAGGLTSYWVPASAVTADSGPP